MEYRSVLKMTSLPAQRAAIYSLISTPRLAFVELYASGSWSAYNRQPASINALLLAQASDVYFRSRI